MAFEDSLGTGMLGQLELRGLRFCELRGVEGGWRRLQSTV